MSNVIKASSIRYNDQKKHVIDTNAAAEEKVKYYLDLLQIKQDEEQLPTESSDFVEGLTAATVEQLTQEEMPEEDPTLLQVQLEQRQQESIDSVNERAKAIIEEAKQEVANMLETARTDATALSVQIRDQAQREGFMEGQKLAKQELEKEKQKLIEQEDKLEKDYEEKIRNFEPVFADLLIAYVKRFTGVLLEDKKDIILYLIEQELLNIESSKVYLIHVSKEDYDMVNSKKSEIAWSVRENAEIEIIEDKMLGRTQCMIETDSRIIDCSLDVQLKNLIHDLKLLAGSKNEEIA